MNYGVVVYGPCLFSSKMQYSFTQKTDNYVSLETNQILFTSYSKLHVGFSFFPCLGFFQSIQEGSSWTNSTQSKYKSFLYKNRHLAFFTLKRAKLAKITPTTCPLLNNQRSQHISTPPQTASPEYLGATEYIWPIQKQISFPAIIF